MHTRLTGYRHLLTARFSPQDVKKKWEDLQSLASYALAKHNNSAGKVLEEETPPRRRIMEKVLKIVQHAHPEDVEQVSDSSACATQENATEKVS